MIQQALLWAAAGTGFTFLMTTIGAAMVFFMKRQSSALMQQIFLGFASGVMIAASIWSLLIPAIDEAAQNGHPGWIPAAGGFILGLVLMLTLDGLMPHLHSGAEQAEGLPSSFRRTTLLVLAVTLHNIPEGMAVGLSFARAAQHTGNAGLFAAAGALAIGIGIQNFPKEPQSRFRSIRRDSAARARSFTVRCPALSNPSSACLLCCARPH